MHLTTLVYIFRSYLNSLHTSCKVGDTDLHAPYKQAIRKCFFLWYSSSIAALRRRKDDEEITLEEYTSCVSRLLSMGILRDKAPGWACKGVESIEKSREREG